MFLRQLVDQKGFYRASDQTFVNLERIQFVGACNPPTDPGRKPLSHRFLRHVPVIYVDYPGETSLKQVLTDINFWFRIQTVVYKFINPNIFRSMEPSVGLY